MLATNDLSTPETRAEVATLQSFVEYAPRDPGPMAGNIRGWWTPLGNYLCALCAGRIMARGCNLPRGSEPAWSDGRPAPFGECCCCKR